MTLSSLNLPPRSPWKRPGTTSLFCPIFLACLLFATGLQADETRAHGRALVVRGAFTVFSLGLDDLAEQLSEDGMDVQVVPAALSRSAADRIICEYVNCDCCGPLVLVGHSLGGDLLPGLARRFARSGLSVDLMVMIDSTNPSNPPANVKRCINMYQSNASPEWFRVFRGAPIRKHSDATELINVDIRELAHNGEADGINHFNIDTSGWVQRMVVNQVRLVAAGSAMDSLTDETPSAGGEVLDDYRVAGRPPTARSTLSDLDLQ
ncbi:MAG: hypothetical protein JJ992_24605 [Planctomycetes bacterium]|nr:hypothetical protein [Planctomycetota bacterium]